jgi:hypothetical protein
MALVVVAWNQMLQHQEANARRVVGFLFEEMRLQTSLPEDFPPIGLPSTSLGKPTINDSRYTRSNFDALEEILV